jgi:hypothetical protein
MNKTELLAALEDGRERFLDALEGLTDAEMTEPLSEGGWSVKEILYHLTRWEAELVKLLWEAGQGVKPTTMHFTQVDVDDTNAVWHKDAKLRALDRVLDDFHAVRNQTLLRVEAFSERDLTDPGRYPWAKGRALCEWIVSDSFEHEAEHEAQIRERKKS